MTDADRRAGVVLRCPTCESRVSVTPQMAHLHPAGTAVEYHCPHCAGRLVFAWPHFRTLAAVDARRKRGAA